MHKNGTTRLTLAGYALFGVLTATMVASATGRETTLHAFQSNGRDGIFASASLILDSSGNLYGTTAGGGKYGKGTVFELMQGSDGEWTEKILHSFGESDTDGAQPYSTLVFDATGNLYGTTLGGGTSGSACGGSGCGTVFELKPGKNGGWTELILHNFSATGNDGGSPLAGVIVDPVGNLYGTTRVGGSHLSGTVFRLSPGTDGTWSESVLHNFQQDGKDGYFPSSTVSFDAKGNLYGTTGYGGTDKTQRCSDYDGCGTVYQLVPSPDGTWKERVIHSFHGEDGFMPSNGVIFDASGNLYGETEGIWGGVFELVPSPSGKWKIKVLHEFGSGIDGSSPQGKLILDGSGRLYGTTYAGGDYDSGTIFRLTPDGSGNWTEKVMRSFNIWGGNSPRGGLTFDASGQNLYGTTSWAGYYGRGTAFEFIP